jgi:hypothetical protein
MAAAAARAVERAGRDEAPAAPTVVTAAAKVAPDTRAPTAEMSTRFFISY